MCYQLVFPGLQKCHISEYIPCKLGHNLGFHWEKKKEVRQIIGLFCLGIQRNLNEKQQLMVVLKITGCVEGVITKMKQLAVSKELKSVNTTEHFIQV